MAAARCLALKVGFDALSIGAVADAVGVSRPAIGYHFKTKSALCKAVRAETHRDIDRAATTTAFFLPGERVSTQLSAFITKIMNPDGGWSAATFLPSLIMDCRRHPDVLEDEAEILGLVRAFFTSSMTTPAAHCQRSRNSPSLRGCPSRNSPTSSVT
ncbi:MAG: TetR/AcrR family transcriptional regulator [Microbacteriaceae bacterium]